MSDWRNERNEYVEGSILDEEERREWERSRAIDLDELRAVAEKANARQVFAEWERERHADDLDGAEWRAGAA